MACTESESDFKLFTITVVLQIYTIISPRSIHCCLNINFKASLFPNRSGMIKSTEKNYHYYSHKRRCLVKNGKFPCAC